MSLSFRGRAIRCGTRFKAPVFEGPLHMARRDQYFGELGETEIDGKYGGRLIMNECFILDRSWVGRTGSQALQLYCDRELVDQIGEHGSIIMNTQQFTNQFHKCTLAHRDTLPEWPARIDDVGLLAGRAGVWYTVVRLHFRQLQIV